ncbi:MAG: FHA domain-containing protein [Chloroflexota bacterium]
MTVQFQFVMRSGPTPGKVFPLEGHEIMIGRETSCNIMINDTEVSRKHARLIRQSMGYLLEDLGSTNGTFINGQRLLEPLLLHGGESVSLSENIILDYESTADPDTTVLTTPTNADNQADAEARVNPEASKPVVGPKTPSRPVSTPATSAPSQLTPVNPEPVQPVIPRKSKINLVILLVVLLGLLCVCGVIAIYLYRAPISFWCKSYPFNLIFKPELYPQCIP